ncbi:MAG: glycosyltransferase family 9 protein [Verrucomicrobiae bacterium]|nr:glycosyltransferase family 9 protein [Verrucomicrobiae bacterium]
MSPPNNILIYRLGSLGDTVIALPCFHLIRKAYPHSKITILTNQPVSGKAAPAMAILENSGLCDDAISYPVGTRSQAELLKVRQTIRQLQPLTLFNLVAGRGFLKSLRDYLFFRSCGIKKIIGTPWHRRDFVVQKTSDGEWEREAQRLASRLASLGPIDLADPHLWDLKLTHGERNQALEALPAHGKNFIAVSVGTKVPVKDWGEANWEKLLASLSEKMSEITLVLLGAPDEWERSEKLRQAWKGRSINFSGKTLPRISAAILERCSLFIGHDSGPMHLAGAMGVPTLGLFSWQNPPGQWFPGHGSWKTIKVLYPPLPGGVWHDGLKMKRGVGEGILLLHPDAAFQEAMELWQANANPTVARFNAVPAGIVNS